MTHEGASNRESPGCVCQKVKGYGSLIVKLQVSEMGGKFAASLNIG